MPPWRVSRVSAKDELVSRFSPPRPIELRPWSNSPPSGPAIPFIGFAAKPIPPPAGPPIPPPAGPPIPAARPIDPAAAPIGEPYRAPGEPAPGACMPADDPSWLRKSSAISRSRPGRSCRPATWASTPTSRGAASRSSTCSTTCTAAVRPNRAIKACGSGSLFLIVPVASSLVMETVWDASSHSRALLILTFTVSPLSFIESSMMRTKGLSTLFPICIQYVAFGNLR